MKRRGFIASVLAGIGAWFAPSVVAKEIALEDTVKPRLWLIHFRHRGCQSLVATYRGPNLVAGSPMLSSQWFYPDGTSPGFGSSDIFRCPDCGSRVAPSSVAMQEIDRFEIVNGYQRA